jgi:hypothetical protein
MSKDTKEPGIDFTLVEDPLPGGAMISSSPRVARVRSRPEDRQQRCARHTRTNPAGPRGRRRPGASIRQHGLELRVAGLLPFTQTEVAAEAGSIVMMKTRLNETIAKVTHNPNS